MEILFFQKSTEMRFTLARLNYKVAYLGKWNKVPGDYNGGKHILPPKISAKDREKTLKELWREARNEMWLVRHKREGDHCIPETFLSF